MSQTSRYVFAGKSGREREHVHDDCPATPEPYVAHSELVKAVNLALFLKRPLLLEGEAGCGKTRLARAVAYELGLPYYAWHVRSTSKAQEGLYTYDAILRLHDVQTGRVEPQKQTAAPEGAAPPPPDAPQPIKPRDPGQASDYRTLGPLGKAFNVHDRPAVVLIDEIDKADIDFPNDLLTVLDDPWQFHIPETGETVSAATEKENRPLVIITSNKEKGNLPAPFLRRCIYSFVEFPNDEQRLKEIVDAHYRLREVQPPTSQLIKAAARRFLSVRKEGSLYKVPGTSEFLDWVEALRGFQAGAYRAARLTHNEQIPYPELLFKLRADWQRYKTPA